MATKGTYAYNSDARPAISHDNGFLDKFAPREPTLEERAQYQLWRAKLEVGEAVQGMPFAPDLPDALAAYRHFMGASGNPRDVNIERYFQYDPSGKTTLRNVGIEAQNAAYDMYKKRFSGESASYFFAGSALSAGASSVYFPYPATENWQKAIGAFKFWLTGSVDVEAIDKKLHFDLVFTFHMEDMYNFNPGQADIATGIPDSENGIFEITGLAKQYLNQGKASRRLQWVGVPAGIPEMQPSDGRRMRRQRQPSDNRRLRNQV